MAAKRSRRRKEGLRKSMDKLLFLDFDGVLNDDNTSDWVGPPETKYRNGHCGLDREKIERLNQILDQTGAKVVISTSWRTAYTGPELAGILTKRGFRHADKIIGQTPRRFSCQQRGGEIEDWLEENAKAGQKFVVLDDMPTQFQKTGNHPITFMESGLTDAHVQAAVKILTDGPGWAPPDREKEATELDARIEAIVARAKATKSS